MFMQNWNGNYVNTAHIIRLSVEPPKYEAVSYQVVALLTYGTDIMCKGTEEECRMYMQNFATVVNTVAGMRA